LFAKKFCQKARNIRRRRGNLKRKKKKLELAKARLPTSNTKSQMLARTK